MAASIHQTLTPEERESVRQELNEAKERWREASIEDYSFNMRRTLSTYGWIPFMGVTVRAGEVQLVTVAESGDTIFAAADVGGGAELWTWVLVEQLFDFIAEELDTAQWVHATFDPKLGYPTSVGIDADVCTLGDEAEVEVEGLRVFSEDSVDEG